MFQLVAHILQGLVAVLTPLKATIVSQLEECKVYGILASSWDAGASAPNIPPGGHVVYLTAEKLMMGDSLPYLQQKGPVLWVFEEAHQVVHSGASFREVWTQVKQMRPPSSETPMYTCTATAMSRDIAGVIEGTGLRRPEIIKTSVCRDNLHLVVEPVDGPLQNETAGHGIWPRTMEIVSTRRFRPASTKKQPFLLKKMPKMAFFRPEMVFSGPGPSPAAPSTLFSGYWTQNCMCFIN